MSTTAWTVLIVANMPIYWLLGWVIFHDWYDFLDCVRFWLTPDIFSILHGEGLDDLWAELRLAAWVILCGGAIYAESQLLQRFI